MESSNQQQQRPFQPTQSGGGYDRVVLREATGKIRQLSRKEFESLPLRERVSHLIAGTADFFAGNMSVSAADAMKG